MRQQLYQFEILLFI